MNTPSLGQTVIHSLCNWKQKWPSNANRIYHIFNHWAQNSVFLEPINFKVLLITLRFVIVYESKRKQLPRFNVCVFFLLYNIANASEKTKSERIGKMERRGAFKRDLTTCFTAFIKNWYRAPYTALSNHDVRTVFKYTSLDLNITADFIT